MNQLDSTLKKLSQPKLNTAVAHVAKELQRAVAKHPIFPCNFEGISIIGQEVGQLCTACNDKWHSPQACQHPQETTQHLMQEAAQVAVTAIRCVAQLSQAQYIMQLASSVPHIKYEDMLSALLESTRRVFSIGDCTGCPLIGRSQQLYCCCYDCQPIIASYITVMLATGQYQKLHKQMQQWPYQDTNGNSGHWSQVFNHIDLPGVPKQKRSIVLLRIMQQKLKGFYD